MPPPFRNPTQAYPQVIWHSRLSWYKFSAIRHYEVTFLFLLFGSLLVALASCIGCSWLELHDHSNFPQSARIWAVIYASHKSGWCMLVPVASCTSSARLSALNWATASLWGWGPPCLLPSIVLPANYLFINFSLWSLKPFLPSFHG